MARKSTLPKVHTSTLMSALAKLTGVKPDVGMTDMDSYLEHLDVYADTSMPCGFGELRVLAEKLPVISDAFIPNRKGGYLVDMLSEVERDTVHLVVDSFIAGTEGIYIVVLTGRLESTLAKWVDFSKKTRLLVSEVEQDTAGNRQYLIVSPLISFI